MKYFLFVYVFFSCAFALINIPSQAQCVNTCSHDSLWTICLTEVNITTGSDGGNAVHNFYRPNKAFTTEDILSRIPALSMTRRSNYGQEPGIRGLSGSRINVSLDGMKIFGACTDKMDPVTIYVEPQNLESFEVETGACGSEHGSTAGGSLNMKLKEPAFSPKPEVHGLTGITYHSIANSIFGFASADISNRSWAFKLNTVYRKSESYKSGDGTIVPFSGYEKNNLSASLKYLLSEKQSIKLDLLTDNGYKIGFPALAMDVRDAHALIGSLSWKYTSPKSMLSEADIKVYGNSIRHLMDDRDRSGLVMHMDMPGTSKTNGLDAKVRMNISKNFNITSKLDYYSNSLFAEMFMYPEGGHTMYMLTLPETKRQVAGIYISPEWNIDSLNKLTLGGRWDLAFTEMNDQLGLAQAKIFYPNIDSSYVVNVRSIFSDYERKLSSKFVAGLQFGFAERLPSSQEMYGFYLYNRLDNHDYIGNPELKNETSTQMSLLLRYASSSWGLSLSPFVNQIKSFIEGKRDTSLSSMTVGAEGVKIYSNSDAVILKGAELTVKYLSSGPFSLISTGKLVYGQKSDGTALWQIPPFKSLTSLKYRIGLYSLQAEAEYSAAQNRVDLDAGETATPSYVIFHLRLNAVWMIGKQSLEFNAGIENITDRLYHEHLDWGGVPRPGRNFYGTVAFRF